MNEHIQEETRNSLLKTVKAELDINACKLAALKEKEIKLQVIQRILNADKPLEDLVTSLIEIAIKS